MTHLMELLKAHQSRDAEASRLQQALQCQEEADAAKLVELMRRQEAASAAAVEEAKAAIEAQLVERFREEQAAAAEAHSAQLQQLSAEHSTQLQQAAALLEAQAREKFETAVAHERVIGAGGARREAGERNLSPPASPPAFPPASRLDSPASLLPTHPSLLVLDVVDPVGTLRGVEPVDTPYAYCAPAVLVLC